MRDQTELIYRSIIIILFLVSLAIFYQYSQNGRYTYHKEISDIGGDNKYVVDSRTGTIYGIKVNPNYRTYFYKIELQTGKTWRTLPREMEDLPEMR